MNSGHGGVQSGPDSRGIGIGTDAGAGVWAGRLDEIVLPRRGLVAIDGPSGAGKSSLAAALVARAVASARAAGRVDPPVALISTDFFATWDNPVAWWPELERDLLGPLLRGDSARYRPLDWSAGDPRPGPLRWLDWAPLVIVEGVSSARRSIAPRLDLALWVEGADSDTRLARALARDGAAIEPQLRDWQAFERGWFAVDGTRARCQVIAESGPESHSAD